MCDVACVKLKMTFLRAELLSSSLMLHEHGSFSLIYPLDIS